MKTYKETIPELTIGRKKSDVKKVKIESPNDSAKFFKEIWDEDTLEYSESVMVIYLNRSNNTIGWFKVSSGGIDSCIIDVRIVLGLALKVGATGFIIAHNHPSGNLNPSRHDEKITEKLRDASGILDITFLDHIILTECGYYSFKESSNII